MHIAKYHGLGNDFIVVDRRSGDAESLAAEDPAAATLERGFYLSYTGMAALNHIRFEDLGDIYPDTGQRHYH
jgi:diaminopimelate epimerase